MKTDKLFISLIANAFCTAFNGGNSTIPPGTKELRRRKHIFNIHATPGFLKSDCLLISLIAIAFCTGCSGGTSPAAPEQKNRDSLKRDIRKKPSSSFTDSLIIDTASVVFFEPDSLQMEKIKQVNEKMIFESLTHDCYYQMKNARQVVEKNWPHLSIRLASKNRWLVFRKIHGEQLIIDLNKINDICGIYLFDPAKDPVKIVMTNIDSELGFYFKRR